jgi:tetratricopeptide (TPR) repeat protein
MFGNRVGWFFSLLIVVGTSGFLVLMYKHGTDASPPGPVGERAASYTMQLPIDPRSLATYMSEPADAVELYKKAIAAYQANPRPFNAFVDRGNLQSPELAEIQSTMDLLLKSRTAKNPGVFKDRPGELITYDTDRPALKDLKTLGSIARKLGMLYRAAGNREKAMEYFEATFALGAKLCEERLVFEEWETGRGLLDVSHYLAETAKEANQPAASERMQEFDQQFLPFYKKQIEPVQQTIFVTHPNTGDMLALATNAGESMWRVEAIFALGRCRFSGETRGDQAAANRVLQRLAQSADPLTRLAAVQARDLTVEQFRKLR